MGESRTIELGGREVALLVRRSARARRLALRIPGHNDSVALVLPSRASEADGMAFLRSRAGWVIERLDRLPPRVPFADGAVLPLGGAQGHKGYGLSAMVEILSGILPGLGFGVDPSGKHNDGCFMAAFKVEAFRPLETFKREVTEFAAFLNSTPPAAGFDRVYYPGEIEHLRTQENLAAGIAVEDATWAALMDLAEQFGLAELTAAD